MSARETAGVVTIGVFDGVHQGHRALLAQARALADERSEKLTCLTFDPHPLRVLRPDKAPQMLSTLNHRRELLGEVGVDHVQVLTFDQNLSQMTARQFVQEILAEQLGAQAVAVGRNFRFGQGAAGNVEVLQELAAEFEYSVHPIDMVTADDAPWSSTLIRGFVADGDVAAAARGLTRLHRVEGPVVRGDQRGRELGFPTANIAASAQSCKPADGVYAAQVVIDPYGLARSAPAAVSVGANSTFDGLEPRVEAFILERGDWNLYGQHVAVDFVDRIREMRKFDSVEELLVAMSDDVSIATELTRHVAPPTDKTDRLRSCASRSCSLG